MFKITPVPENASSRQDPFQNRTFYEQVNPAKLDDLIFSKVLREEWSDDEDPRKKYYENEREQLLAIQSNIATRVATPGVQPVKYSRTEDGIGRVYPEKSRSIGSIRRKLRHTLAADQQQDIDIENAHPTFALHLFKTEGRELPALEYYIHHRKEILAEITNNSTASRDDAKELFIRLLYGGGTTSWERDTGVPISTLPSTTQELVRNFNTEMTTIINAIAADNPELLTKYADRPNPKSSVASLFFQDLERRILEILFRSLCLAKLIPSTKTRNINIYNAVLCFDGLMIPRDGITREQLTAVFKRCQKNVMGLYKIPINLTIKEMTEGYSDAELKEIASFAPEPLPFNYFNHATIMDRVASSVRELADIAKMPQETPEQKDAVKNSKTAIFLKSYQAMKDYFEDQFFVVTDPSGICQLTPNGVDLKNIKEVKDLCLSLIIPGTNPNPRGTNKFVDYWLEDIHSRRHYRTDFYPPPLKCPRQFYNTYRPFTITNHPPTTSTIPPLYEKHLRILTGGDDDAAYQYLINYIAHLIQKPGELPLVALLFKSDQGTGKNLFFESFGRFLLGSNYYKEVNAKDVFGTFATLRDQLVVVMDEFSGKDGFANADALKALITGAKLAINEKYKPKYEINNCLRLILFSNNTTPIKIEASDRRFVAFECSNEHANDRTGQFNYLVPALRDRTQMRQFYDFLLNRDISNYHPAENRPITKLQRELQSVNIPALHLFLDDYITKQHQTTSTTISSQKLYAKFCEYCEFSNISLVQGKCSISMRGFAIQLKRLPGVEHYRTKKERGFVLKHELIRGALLVQHDDDGEEGGGGECDDDDDGEVATGGAAQLGEVDASLFGDEQ